MTDQTEMYFDGRTYKSEHDKARLSGQLLRVLEVMNDGEWRTLRELSDEADGSEASVSARLRDLRKPRFGARIVERRRRGQATRGIHEYRLRGTLGCHIAQTSPYR
jgi:hypothetical protein